MNIGLLNIMHNKVWDFRPDLAQTYADALKNAVELHLPNDIEKQHGYFLSKKGYQKDGKTVGANFEDKLYVGNIHRIERHLYWNDEELQEDDEIINVVVVDGPVTRDGDGCSYGTKDFRDQVMYANQIPQVIGHLFLINTPGGQASCRNDYEMMIDDCRQAGKPTVAFIDGMCCSSGVNLACRCDRVVVMNPRDEFGCIGTMAAFWAVAHDTVDKDGYRYVELVGKDCPEKNDWYREAAKGEYEKLQAELDRDTEQFHQTVRENRPLVTADMLTGKVFEAQEVMPALVDEIGDMNRAIECIYELANETLTAARLVTAEPKNEPDGEQPEGEEPEEMAKLNAQQKAAVATSRGDLRIVDDGHVKKEEQGFFGPETVEIAKPQNQEDMTDEEKKAAEVAEQPAATQEQTPATEQPAEGAAATEAPAVSEENAQEEQPAAQEGAPAAEPAAEPASQEAQENAAAEIDKIQETLHTAEQKIAEKDKEIAQLKETLATLNGIAEERDQVNATLAERDKTIETLTAEKDEQGKTIAEHVATITAKDAKIAEHVATIEKLNKQVKELQSEVKELSEKPAPMVDEQAGIPQDNGTGDAPQYNGIKSAVKPGMTPKEIAAALRKQDEEIAARNNRR
jgi:ClpP class serine protease